MELVAILIDITFQSGHIRRNTEEVGAGIVADSVPEKEYEETVNKGKALFRAVEMAGKGLI